MPAKLRIALIAVLAAAVSAPAATAQSERPAKAKIAVGKGDRARAKSDRAARKRERLRARATQECANADVHPSAANLRIVREAIRCLHNQIRARNGLPALRENARLRRAALRHSRDMVTGGFFQHTAPSGATMVDRILRARYARRGEGWALGENLAWGTGSLATARGAVEAWMDSPGHRANILKRAYRELGVGVVLGVPVSDAAGATYTVDFGVRR